MQHNYFKYLNITPVEHQWGMYVTTVGYAKVQPEDQYPNERHPDSHQLTWERGRILNDYYIVFISKGKGSYSSLLADPCEVVAGNCFLLYPGVRHRYKPNPKHGWEEYWVGFNGIHLQHIMEKGVFDPEHPIVDLGFNTEMLTLYNKLIDLVRASSVGYPQQIAGVTIQLLGLVSTVARYNERADDPIGKLIAKAKFILQESYKNSVDMEQLAFELPMGYSSFRKAFKNITGQSPNQYHLNLRLERAKHLLMMTNLNINEIADQTGFESVFYFSKLFKKKQGISPRSFRLNREIPS
ncbi:AraC family transcriptional regulator [Pedobacter sp. L105]|uniref:helix-turn-helix domain-containing protein n=1 Tax=Pedobacter sp. L105 TaxID=1641871 RepID=UPI00131D9EF9|nr:AraC family transcriptional regulator [Pedobacter sp. L105]